MKTEIATLAGGCFWCTEAVFERLKGVIQVESGYTGGDVENPSYDQVSMGNTGHAEAIQIIFDPGVISYEKLLEVFWATHNPTTTDQQGHDFGHQYRSVIFYHNEEQKKLAEASKEKLVKSGSWLQPIVTTIEPFTKFYPASVEHQDYYENNRNAPYCRVVIDPKIKKLMKEFKKDIKK